MSTIQPISSNWIEHIFQPGLLHLVMSLMPVGVRLFARLHVLVRIETLLIELGCPLDEV